MEYYQSIELQNLDGDRRQNVEYNTNLLQLKTLIDQRQTGVSLSHWLIAIQVYCLWPLLVAKVYADKSLYAFLTPMTLVIAWKMLLSMRLINSALVFYFQMYNSSTGKGSTWIKEVASFNINTHLSFIVTACEYLNPVLESNLKRLAVWRKYYFNSLYWYSTQLVLYG